MINIQTLALDTNILSLGSILGTQGSKELIEGINARSGSGSFFSSAMDPFRNGFQNFVNTIIDPIRNVGILLENTARQILQPDVFKPITSEDELKQGIPSCMQLGVLYFAPVRQQLEEERIEGWGVQPETLMAEDPYERLINNNHAVIHSSLLTGKGDYTISTLESTVDPELSYSDIRALDETRQFIANFMNDEETTHYDVTNYPELHC